MKRLLDPKKFISDAELVKLPIIIHNGIQYREFIRNESYRTPTGCQCYKDCNCAETAGQWNEVYVTYYRKVEFDFTGKAFYSDLNYEPVRYK